jgi:hypothetical protein
MRFEASRLIKEIYEELIFYLILFSEKKERDGHSLF